MDPFSSQGTFCSIYSGPLKVDWFIAESIEQPAKDSKEKRVLMVWNGNSPAPYDWESHPWDWLYWLWCKARSKKYELVCSELPKLWQFLRLHGINVEEFPAIVPEPDDSAKIMELLIAMIDKLPKTNLPLAREISQAMVSKK